MIGATTPDELVDYLKEVTKQYYNSFKKDI